MRSSGWSVGRGARRRARSLRAPAAMRLPPTDRRTRGAVVPLVVLAVAWLATVLHPMAGLAVGVAPGGWQVVRARRAAAADARALVESMPDVIDLFRVATGAGATVHEAVCEVATFARGTARVALVEVVRRTSRGERLASALPVIVDHLGDPARPLVAALLSCERDGAALAAPLERASLVARDVRRRAAEAAARRVPVRLVLPLVMCVLPAFALLTVVPLLAGTLRSLAP